MKINYDKLSPFAKGLIRYKSMLFNMSVEEYLGGADERFTSLVKDWRNPLPCGTSGIPLNYDVYETLDDANIAYEPECDLAIISESQAIIIVDGLSRQLSLEWNCEWNKYAMKTLHVHNIEWSVGMWADSCSLPESIDVDVPLYGSDEQWENLIAEHITQVSEACGARVISYSVE